MRSTVPVLICLAVVLCGASCGVAFRHQLEQYLGTLVALDPTERLVIDDGFNQVAWHCNTCHANINRYWQNPYVITLSGSTTSWYHTVFSLVYTRASNIDCYVKAREQLRAHANDTDFDRWKFDLTRAQWEVNFDKYNYYKQKISQKFFEQTEKSNGSLIFTADSIVRVNVTVGPWFNPGFLWTFKDAYLNTFTNGETAMDFFFNKKTGAFNSIMTGMVVMSNIATNSTFYWNDGSKSSGSSWSNYPLNPYIFAWIIKQIPQQAEC